MPSTVTIDKLVYGGDGLGRIDGQVVLAPFVLPGENVALETSKAKKGLLRGSNPQVVAASPHRIQPRCEYFGECGGCQYQHADYPFQLTQKVEILRETLRRLGGVRWEDEVAVISGDPWFYRNRVQLHFAVRRSGFHKAESHDLCAVDHCYIAAPILVETIGRIRKAAKRPEWPAFLQSAEFFTNGNELQLNILDSARPVAARFFEWCSELLPSLAKGAIDYSAGPYRFRISGGSFFQVNRFLIEPLVEEVLSDSSGSYAMDLYAGVGLFSLPLSQRFARVDAVERGGSGFRDLEANILQGTGNVRANRATAESFLQPSANDRADLVVVDPPRSGLGTETTAAILEHAAPRLTIVSCDPTTLARDLQKLTTKYRIRRLALVDLFPQTFHFETVAHLETL